MTVPPNGTDTLTCPPSARREPVTCCIEQSSIIETGTLPTAHQPHQPLAQARQATGLIDPQNWRTTPDDSMLAWAVKITLGRVLSVCDKRATSHGRIGDTSGQERTHRSTREAAFAQVRPGFRASQALFFTQVRSIGA